MGHSWLMETRLSALGLGDVSIVMIFGLGRKHEKKQVYMIIDCGEIMTYSTEKVLSLRYDQSMLKMHYKRPLATA